MKCETKIMKGMVVLVILLIVSIHSSFGKENMKCDVFNYDSDSEKYQLLTDDRQFKLIDDNFFDNQNIFVSDSKQWRELLLKFRFSILLTSQKNQNKMNNSLIENRETKLQVGGVPFYKGIVLIYLEDKLMEKICFEYNEVQKITKVKYENDKVIKIENFDGYVLKDLITFSSAYKRGDLAQLKIIPKIYVDASYPLQFGIGYYFEADIYKAMLHTVDLEHEYLLYRDKVEDPAFFNSMDGVK